MILTTRLNWIARLVSLAVQMLGKTHNFSVSSVPLWFNFSHFNESFVVALWRSDLGLKPNYKLSFRRANPVWTGRESAVSGSKVGEYSRNN